MTGEMKCRIRAVQWLSFSFLHGGTKTKERQKLQKKTEK